MRGCGEASSGLGARASAWSGVRTGAGVGAGLVQGLAQGLVKGLVEGLVRGQDFCLNKGWGRGRYISRYRKGERWGRDRLIFYIGICNYKVNSIDRCIGIGRGKKISGRCRGKCRRKYRGRCSGRDGCRALAETGPLSGAAEYGKGFVQRWCRDTVEEVQVQRVAAVADVQTD